jgi:hypothetical protein
MERLKLKTVLHWIDAVQFAMGEQVLQAAGIPCDQHGRTINSAEDPSAMFVINRLALQVREQDFERARDLLRETIGRGVVEDDS